jgi:site-specific recombinase XerD
MGKAWLVTSGVPLAVRDLLGHRSISTTEIYAHLLPNIARAAVEKIAGCYTSCHTSDDVKRKSL